MKKRINSLELIDLGDAHYSLQEYESWLYQMERIGKLLGGNKATFSAFNKLKKDPESILDVGCGGGAFTRLLAKKYPNAKVVGIDTSEQAINYANKRLKSENLSNINFIYTKDPELNEPNKSFDVVTCTLLCHHLDDQKLIDFLKKSSKIAKQAVIINDLHRNWLAFTSFKIISRILFSNRLVIHDGPISIQRSFSYKDWVYYLAQAELNNYKISWHWSFRWVIFIELNF